MKIIIAELVDPTFLEWWHHDDSSGFRSTNTYFFNSGLDSLLSIVQMSKGIPVSTFAVGKSSAINAALKQFQISF